MKKRLCRKCNKAKPVAEMVPRAACKGGYAPLCRDCRRIMWNAADVRRALSRPGAKVD